MALAAAGPSLLLFNLHPSLTFFNQALAFIGWGSLLVCLVGGLAGRGRVAVNSGLLALLALFGLLSAEALLSVWRHGLPWGRGVVSLGTFGAAAACLLAGSFTMQSASSAPGGGSAWHRHAVLAFFAALVLAGGLNMLIAIYQMFARGPQDSFWIVRRIAGFRAAGNLRQPNLLSTQLVWGMVGLALLVEWRRLPGWLALPLGAGSLLAVALSGSRIGAVLVCLLAGWGLFDHRLRSCTRRSLLAAPLLLGAFWLLLLVAARYGWGIFSDAAQVTQRDYTDARSALWRQTLQLIAAQPWAGVGWGEFNFAWTLTPLQRQAGDTFTHTHNLLLQWAVELGLPAMLLLLALLAVALRAGWQRRAAGDGDLACARRASGVMVLSVLLHSLTEYPLWYAYFLLPTTFAFGLWLAPAAAAERGDKPARSLQANALAASGWAMALAAALAVHDARPVFEIYRPHEQSASEQELIAQGRRSIVLGHAADRLASIITRNGERSLQPFVRGTQDMIDMRLLIAWAQALHEAGQTDRARYLAARLREFDDPAVTQFFAACVAPLAAAAARPFQCDAPTGNYSFRDFR